MNKRQIPAWLLCGSLLMSVTGCLNSDSGNDNATTDTATDTTTPTATTLTALYDPAAGVMPPANDLLFQNSTDGTLNAPTDTVTDAGQLRLLNAINTLDGFGLTAPMTASFDGALQAASLNMGTTVRVFELATNSAGSVTGIAGELDNSSMATGVAGSDAKTLVLIPLKPLKESTRYLVVLTDGLRGTDGGKAGASDIYTLAKGTTALTGSNASLEQLRQLVNQQESLAATRGVSSSNIILSWTFTTVSVTPELQAAANAARSSTLNLSIPLTGSTLELLHMRGLADVYVGTLEVPYYLEAPSTAKPLAPLSAYWQGQEGTALTRYNPVPVATSTQTIPLLLTVPKTPAPEAGWPVVIFQHGITRSRQDLLAIADTLAKAGLAAVAIDLPLHGVATNPLHTNNERTFNLDLINNTTGASGADGVADPSGTHFINLGSLLTSRDNIRQGVADLLTLRNSLGNISSTPDIKLDTSRVGFIGHSLGGIVGSVYLGTETRATPASLVTTGGGIARLLDNSPAFGPSLHQGLAAAGLERGTLAYDTYMAVAQTILDAADPVVLAAQAAKNHDIHMIEVVGVNGTGSDQVIPNRVATAPLSGTEPLVSLMKLSSVASTAAVSDGIVRFTSGVHGSILGDGNNLPVTAEMQYQVAAFQTSQGDTIRIQDSTLVTTTVP